MTKADVLTILKSDLNMPYVTETTVAAHLSHLIDTAIGFIETEGIEFTQESDAYAFTASEAQLIVMYAAYLYRKRATEEGMPRMLRWALNNAVIKQKASTTDAS